MARLQVYPSHNLPDAFGVTLGARAGCSLADNDAVTRVAFLHETALDVVHPSGAASCRLTGCLAAASQCDLRKTWRPVRRGVV